MTDTTISKMSDPDLLTVLKKVSTNVNQKDDVLKKIYLDEYNTLMGLLGKNKQNIRGLMSQAIVPRLVQKMAKISKGDKQTKEALKTELTKYISNATSDYPYARTQIIEVVTKLRNKEKDLIFKFNDPLLVTAVRITNALMKNGKMKFIKPTDRQAFSSGVNQIKDLIVRHIILAKAGVIPMVGDATMPDTKAERQAAKADSKIRALGLGENPNPEVAAILNPGLVMEGDEQKQYHRDLAMLAELISPKEPKNLTHRSVGDAFKNAGFEYDAEVTAGEVKNSTNTILQGYGGDDSAGLEEDLNVLVEDVEKGVGVKQTATIKALRLKLNTANEELEEAQAFSEEMAKQVRTLEKEKKQLKTELSETKSAAAAQQIAELNKQIIEKDEIIAELESKAPVVEKPKVDFANRARVFLIEYLGVKENIFEFTKKWMELYALKPKNKIFTPYQTGIDIKRGDDVLRIGLSSLITGNEIVGIRRQSKAYLEPEEKVGRRSTKPNVILTHDELITYWKAKKPEGDAPVDTEEDHDLIILKPSFGIEGEKLIEEIKLALGENITSSLSTTQSFSFYQPRLNNNNTSTTTPTTTTRRRRRQRNRTDERVLMW